MRKLWAILPALILVSTCSKKDSPPQTTIIGVYAGSFERIYGDTGIKRGVSITFSTNKFSGSSDSTHYPAICNGSYAIAGDSINFQNQCDFPANFDWTYILNGKYSLKIKNDSLQISHTYGDFIYEADIYRLKKQ
jgi:hypothetical protein